MIIFGNCTLIANLLCTLFRYLLFRKNLVDRPKILLRPFLCLISLILRVTVITVSQAWSESPRKLIHMLKTASNADTGISPLTGTLPYAGSTWLNLNRTRVECHLSY